MLVRDFIDDSLYNVCSALRLHPSSYTLLASVCLSGEDGFADNCSLIMDIFPETQPFFHPLQKDMISPPFEMLQHFKKP